MSMDHCPVFRLEPLSSDLTLSPSPEAIRVAEAYQRPGSSEAWRVKMPEQVREQAKARVRHGGGDPRSCRLVLSESELQFGRYRGRTFRWLLSHDVGYAAGLLASHQKERESGDASSSPLMVNKDDLASYAKLFPEMVTAVISGCATEGSLSVQTQDQRLVGFGPHAGKTYASLYESTSAECQTYVQWLRKQTVAAGTKLHTLQSYVLGRDKEKGTSALPPPPPLASPHALPAHPSQQPEGVSSHVAASSQPSDEMLHAAAMEVDAELAASAPPPAAVAPRVQPRGDDGVAQWRSGAARFAPRQPEAPQVVSGAEVKAPSCSKRWQLLSVCDVSVPVSQLLPQSWRKTLPEEQHDWLGRALFKNNPSGQTVLTTNLRLWWYPPGPQLLYTQPPTSAHAFFQRPFFLWMPYRMWAYKLACPECQGKLTGAGLYRTVRRVLDSDGWYFMGTEYLECNVCRKKFAAWSQDIIDQLDPAHQEQFPAVLTYKLSCHKAVIGLLRERTLGNSATHLHTTLVEQHTREWMSRLVQYLSVLRKLRVPGAAERVQVSFPNLHPVPSVPWLISVYVRDALSRLEETKARVTSIFGVILKINSTKKMTTKLAGGAAGTAAWVTNVGNEHGQVLISVLTAAEGGGLLPMAAGLMRRYRLAGEAPPRVLYVDRDCCSLVGQTRTSAMFHEWNQLLIRLDAWHLMRRFSRGVTTESHQLYGQFMARLSYAIFEWDKEDVSLLEKAKQCEEGKDAYIQLSARELAHHCRRRTRGAAETELLIQELLDAFWELRDSLGVLLIDHGRMREIWSTQRRHLQCIQDPPGIELYTKTEELTRGGLKLPIYRCARGSTSLELFHLHLCHFVPGTSASALHFQVYLLEGLVRWNENRARAAVKGPQQATMRCYSARLQHDVNQLTQEFLGMTLVENYTQPRDYTGELIGVEYLYSQTGVVLQEDVGRNPDVVDGLVVDEEWGSREQDEGFEEPEDLDFLEHHHRLIQGTPPLAQAAPAADASTFQSGPTNTAPSQDEAAAGMVLQLMEDEEEEEPDVRGPDGRSGYQHVSALAEALVELRHQKCVTQPQALVIVALWLKLPDRDKAAVSFPPRHQGRLKTSRSAHTPSMDRVQRAVLGKGAGAAQSPKASRLVEAIFVQLCQINYEGRTLAGVRINRWGLIMRDYNIIRDIVASCLTITNNTSMYLVQVNQRTLTQWHTERRKANSSKYLPTAAQSLPPPRALLSQPVRPDEPFHHHLPKDNSGEAVTRRGPVAQAFYDIIASATAASSSVSGATAPGAAETSATAADTTVSSTCTAADPVPRTTAWQRKLREEQLRLARERGEVGKEPRKNFKHFLCRRCGKPKNKQYGHSRYRAEHFCSTAEGRSVDDWLAEKRRQDPKKSQPPGSVL